MANEITRTKKPKPLTPGHPDYKAADQKLLKERKARIASSHAASDVEQWMEGNEYLGIRDGKLYVQDGYRSMSRWVAQSELRSRSVVARRMRFAENFSLAQVRRFGKDKLDLALAYVSHTVAKDDAWKLRSLVIKVPGPDGAIEDVRFAVAKPWQIEAAIVHQLALSTRRAGDALPDSEQAFLDGLVAAVHAEERPLAEIRATPSGSGHPDDTIIEVRARVADLPSVLERLQQKLIAPAPRPPKRRR
jgi:hypothetical protein